MVRLCKISILLSISCILLWGGYTVNYSSAEFSFYVESLVISQFHLVQISGEYFIYPAQPLFDGWYRYSCYSHNLFGSPYTEIWTNIPRNFDVSHPIQIPAGQGTNFRVRVKDAITNTPISYAKVCLNKSDDVYQVGYTNGNGQVSFFITPQTEGIIKITVTRSHNLNNNYVQYYPSRTICLVGGSEDGKQTRHSKEIFPAAVCITKFPSVAKDNVILKYNIAKKGIATISIYNILGSRVWTVNRRFYTAGCYEQKIDTKKLSSGIYFIVLTLNNEKISKKFILTKQN